MKLLFASFLLFVISLERFLERFKVKSLFIEDAVEKQPLFEILLDELEDDILIFVSLF